MTETYDEMLAVEIRKLLAGYAARPSEERVSAYVLACKYKAIGSDRLARAVQQALSTWEKPGPPPPAVLIAMAFGRAGESDPEEAERKREWVQMHDMLERLCDYDAHAFNDAYGHWPDRHLFSRYKATPGPGMTFAVIPRAICDAKRKEAIDACRAAFHNLRKKTEAVPSVLSPAADPDLAHGNEPEGQLELPGEPEAEAEAAAAEPETADQAAARHALDW